VNVGARHRDGFSTEVQGGIALVIVLWLVVLMSVIAAGHSRNVHIETRLAARHVDTSAARHVAEAAVQLSILKLLSANELQPGETAGRPQHLQLFGREVSVSMRRASGLVDLNAAGDRLLYALFVAAGADHQTAQQLTGATLDWRDVDSTSRTNGAEDDDYRALGMPWTARDDHFTVIDELRYVLGMSREIFDGVAPYVTVYSKRPGVDIDAAPEFLIDVLAASRLATGSGRTTSATAGAYHISIVVEGADSMRVSTETVVLLADKDGDRPFTILEWRETSRAPATQKRKSST